MIEKSASLNSLFTSEWLLCAPNYFDVTYEINPWMNKKHTPEESKAKIQWQNLHHTLLRLGAYVHYVEPVEGLPDLVFTANAGLVLDSKVVLSSFKHPERQGEEEVFKNWFEQKGFEVHQLKGSFYEGEGDSLFAGRKLFCGYGSRSDLESYEQIGSILNIEELVPCELVNDRFYHLDTCFAPLNDKLAIFHKEAFSPSTIKHMEKNIELIAVPEKDAERFVCNAVVLGNDGNDIVMPSGCDETYALLAERGFKCHGVELSEFLKGGGSSKCLTLKVDRTS